MVLFLPRFEYQKKSKYFEMNEFLDWETESFSSQSKFFDHQ